MPHETVATSICNNCVVQRKELSFEIQSMLYEDYLRSSSLAKPDLIVGFNTNIHESKEAVWAFAELGCPVILTCYTQMELEEEQAKISAILENKTKCIYLGKNPFASLRPYRDYETEELFYQNNYIIIYRTLHWWYLYMYLCYAQLHIVKLYI